MHRSRLSHRLATLAVVVVWCLPWMGFVPAATAGDKVIHVFVALADNASQGIIPVTKKIGDGDKPDDNLYWGCDEGLKGWLARSKIWKRTATLTKPGAKPDTDPVILERLVFRHASGSCWLVADAYRGREIKRCMSDYFAAAGGRLEVSITANEVTFAAGGAADLIIYAGHNGLLDFSLDPAEPAKKERYPDAAAFCCIGQKSVGSLLVRQGARPLILTTQLMYPGAFLVEATANGWLAGEKPAALLQRVAEAYAKNQRISVKSAAGVFTIEAPKAPAP